MTDEHVCVSVCVLVLRSHSHAQRSTTEFILLVSSAPAMWPLAISTVITCPVSDLPTVSPPGCCDADLCSASLSLYILNDFCQTSYLNICPSDLCQICTACRTMVVDDQSGISFSIRQWMLSRQPIIVGLIHRTEFRRHSPDGVSYNKRSSVCG